MNGCFSVVGGAVVGFALTILGSSLTCKFGIQSDGDALAMAILLSPVGALAGAIFAGVISRKK